MFWLGTLRPARKKTRVMKQKTEYQFTNPGLWKGLDPEVAVKELERIRKKHGTLKPEIVIEESAPENSVLHQCFQWDDTIAAYLWRKEQARKLITNITVVVVNQDVAYKVRAMVNVARDESVGRSYIPITEAIHDDTAYKDLLNQAKDEMESFVTKYSQISELNPVKAEMLKVINS